MQNIFMKYARFLAYGMLGWAMEILFTGLGSAIRGDVRLLATTYLWMFPIYGLALFLEPVHDKIRAWHWVLRGFIWVVLIWMVEYVTGGVIRLATGVSPWDYSGRTVWEIDGLIRLDMAPLWFAAGLLFERVHDILVRRMKI